MLGLGHLFHVRMRMQEANNPGFSGWIASECLHLLSKVAGLARNPERQKRLQQPPRDVRQPVHLGQALWRIHRSALFHAPELNQFLTCRKKPKLSLSTLSAMRDGAPGQPWACAHFRIALGVLNFYRVEAEADKSGNS